MTSFLSRRRRAGRAVGLAVSVLLGAVTGLVALGAAAYPSAPVPPGRASTLSPTDDEILVESYLYQLLTPALRIAAKPQIQSLVRTAAGRMFDGDTNVVFTALIQEAEALSIIDDSDQDWVELKSAVAMFASIDGYAYDPQIYIPNYELGVMPTAHIEMAVAPADEDVGAVTGYWLDDIGYVRPTNSMIDAAYFDVYEVWVLSINPRFNLDPPQLQSLQGGAPPGPQAPGVNLVCNPTGLRNNLGNEHLQRWRVPDVSKFGEGFEGRRTMSLVVITTSGRVVKRAVLPKVSRRHIDNWQNAEMFITTWDRAEWGDVMAYQWLELDGGKTTTMTINVPIEGGGSMQVQVQKQAGDDDGGMTPVRFSESTFQLYDTGSVQFNVCTQGGDGGTGFENVACGALASASSTHSEHRVWRATDCDTNPGVNYSWTNRKGTDVRTSLQWVQVDFGVNRTVALVRIYTSQGYAIRAFDVQVWTGSAYLTVGSVTNNTALAVDIPIGVHNTRLVRIVGRLGSPNQPHYARVNELEVYGV